MMTEEELRTTLTAYRQSKRADYLNAINARSTFNIFTTSIITAKSFTDETANILFAPFSFDPYRLVVDKFGIMIFRAPDEIKIDFILSFSNLTINDCRMIIFSE